MSVKCTRCAKFFLLVCLYMLWCRWRCFILYWRLQTSAYTQPHACTHVGAPGPRNGKKADSKVRWRDCCAWARAEQEGMKPVEDNPLPVTLSSESSCSASAAALCQRRSVAMFVSMLNLCMHVYGSLRVAHCLTERAHQSWFATIADLVGGRAWHPKRRAYSLHAKWTAKSRGLDMSNAFFSCVCVCLFVVWVWVWACIRCSFCSPGLNMWGASFSHLLMHVQWIIPWVF